MRLCCDVEVRNTYLPSVNVSKNCRPSKCRLSLTKKAEVVTLVISTQKNTFARSYKINGNIEQMFTKFASEGKATLRFMTPQDDVSLSAADPIQLKSFLRLLQLVSCGRGIDKISSAVVVPFRGTKATMTILTMKDYPMTTTFPSSLVTLRVSNCGMKRVDSRILQLKNLTSLNLSENRLGSFPEDLGLLRGLQEVDLSRNLLTEFPKALLGPSVTATLRTLILSHNSIPKLPPGIGKLSRLYKLAVAGSGLTFIPHSLGDMAASLRVLDLADNLLHFLPVSIRLLRLESLDLHGNPLYNLAAMEYSCAPNCQQVATLQELAARAVSDYRVKFTSDDLPMALQEYVRSGQLCMCGRYCYETGQQVFCNLKLSSIVSTCILLPGLADLCPVQAFVCCYQHQQQFFRDYGNKPIR